MQTILTSTAIADMFGPGLNGFNQDPEMGPPTEIGAQIMNSIMMEVINVATANGAALDSANKAQMRDAISSWVFVDPRVTGEMVIEGTGSVVLESGATLTADAGATIVVNGAFVAGGPSASFLVNCVADFNGAVNMNGSTTSIGDSAADALSVTATATFNSQVIFGTAGSSINGLMTFIAAGAPSGGITSDTSALMTWNGQATFSTRLTITATTSNAGDIGQDGGSRLQWTDATSTKYVHVSEAGQLRSHGQASTLGAAAASLSLDTTQSVAPRVATNLDVRAEAWVSRAIAGSVTVSLTEVGVGQIGTNAVRNVVATAVGEGTQICFSRTHAASTTPRIYRFTVDGGGSNVTVTQARITVEPAIVLPS